MKTPPSGCVGAKDHRRKGAAMLTHFAIESGLLTEVPE
jgi:hypothetical protein